MVVLLGLALAVAAPRQEPAVLVPVAPVPVRHEPELPALARPVLQLPPGPLLRHLLSMPLPQVVVESEVRLRLRCQSFSAAMARSSPLTGKPTCERAPSTR